MEKRVLLSASPLDPSDSAESTEVSSYVSVNDGAIYQVDVLTGEQSLVGTTEVTMVDLAQNAQGQLYGVDTQNQLWKIGPNAESTLIGGGHDGTISGINHSITSLEFSPDGRLIGATPETLIEVDLTTGETSELLTLPTVSQGRAVGDLTFDESGIAFVADSHHLIRIDASLSNAEVVGEVLAEDRSRGGIDPIEMRGLIGGDDGFLYGVAISGKTYRINPDTAAAEEVTTLEKAISVFDPTKPFGPDNPSLGVIGYLGATGPLMTGYSNGGETYVSVNGGGIYRVDVLTGEQSLFGTAEVTMVDLAQNAQGQLYGVDGQNQLWKIGPNAESTLIGGGHDPEDCPDGTLPSFNHSITSLEFSPDGRLIGATPRTLVEFDLTTGENSEILTLPVISEGRSVGDLTFDESGVVYITDSHHLVRVDASLSNAEVVGEVLAEDRSRGGIDPIEMRGLIGGDDGFLYGVAISGKTYRINPDTAAAEEVTTLEMAIPVFDPTKPFGPDNPGSWVTGYLGATGPLMTGYSNGGKTYVSVNGGGIYQVDVLTGEQSLFGTAEVTMVDLAQNAQGQLYGVDGQNQLWKIGPNAESTLIGGGHDPEDCPDGTLPSFNHSITSLEFSPDGRLIGATPRTLVEFDLTTGENSEILTLPVISEGRSVGDLTFDESGVVYITDSHHLVRVDASLSNAEVVGEVLAEDRSRGGIDPIEMRGLIGGDDGFLYGVAISGKTYRINPDTAAAEEVTTLEMAIPVFDPTKPFGPDNPGSWVTGYLGATGPLMTGYTAEEAGKTYVSNNGGKIFEVDLLTGEKQEVAQLPTMMWDIAQDADGQLYGVGIDCLFWRIELDGESTVIGESHRLVTSLEFRDDGRLFGSDGRSLFEFDSTTGDSWEVMSLPDLGIPDSILPSGDIAVDESGNLFVAAASKLIRVDADLTSAEVVGTLPDSIEGLAAGENGALYAADNLGIVYRINTETAEAEQISRLAPPLTPSDPLNVLTGATGPYTVDDASDNGDGGDGEGSGDGGDGEGSGDGGDGEGSGDGGDGEGSGDGGDGEGSGDGGDGEGSGDGGDGEGSGDGGDGEGSGDGGDGEGSGDGGDGEGSGDGGDGEGSGDGGDGEGSGDGGDGEGSGDGGDGEGSGDGGDGEGSGDGGDGEGSGDGSDGEGSGDGGDGEGSGDGSDGEGSGDGGDGEGSGGDGEGSGDGGDGEGSGDGGDGEGSGDGGDGEGSGDGGDGEGSGDGGDGEGSGDGGDGEGSGDGGDGEGSGDGGDGEGSGDGGDGEGSGDGGDGEGSGDGGDGEGSGDGGDGEGSGDGGDGEGSGDGGDGEGSGDGGDGEGSGDGSDGEGSGDGGDGEGSGDGGDGEGSGDGGDGEGSGDGGDGEGSGDGGDGEGSGDGGDGEGSGDGGDGEGSGDGGDGEGSGDGGDGEGSGDGGDGEGSGDGGDGEGSGDGGDGEGSGDGSDGEGSGDGGDGEGSGDGGDGEGSGDGGDGEGSGDAGDGEGSGGKDDNDSGSGGKDDSDSGSGGKDDSDSGSGGKDDSGSGSGGKDDNDSGSGGKDDSDSGSGGKDDSDSGSGGKDDSDSGSGGKDDSDSGSGGKDDNDSGSGGKDDSDSGSGGKDDSDSGSGGKDDSDSGSGGKDDSDSGSGGKDDSDSGSGGKDDSDSGSGGKDDSDSGSGGKDDSDSGSGGKNDSDSGSGGKDDSDSGSGGKDDSDSGSGGKDDNDSGSGGKDDSDSGSGGKDDSGSGSGDDEENGQRRSLAPVANDNFLTVASDSSNTLDLLADDVATTGQLDRTSIEFDSGSDTVGTWEANEDGTVDFTPPSEESGFYKGRYRIADQDGNVSDWANVKVMVVKTGPKMWRNSVNATDVDGDGEVMPIDALRIINDLNRRGTGSALPKALGGSDCPSAFVDVTGDGMLTPRDALLVINMLNRKSRSIALGQGESIASPSSNSGVDFSDLDRLRDKNSGS